jgi:hypothetical protein
VQPQAAALDRELEAGSVFGWAAAGFQERRVDQLDEDPLVQVGKLDQLARGFLGISQGRIGGEFHGGVAELWSV